ncbi:Sec-independent protein translocase subunit TatA [Aliikangiella marina]|uniref:Sec-independent protein translocase protein TatA n=1 Tax=Aliikangiella marina TaxID=1712262 RepID=A0A545TBS0_9GAMM|nr:Sec-independent protein translocase subunit TatA [Aliikangiella marina]TQV74654.1 Sec-independent protein translocase subunit TatA [Aliikangiella marina]
MAGISIWQLLIILVIVILLFGTKRLKNIGSDLGGAFKGFKKAVNDGQESTKDSIENKEKDSVIEGEVVSDKEKEKTKAE